MSAFIRPGLWLFLGQEGSLTVMKGTPYTSAGPLWVLLIPVTFAESPFPSFELDIIASSFMCKILILRVINKAVIGIDLWALELVHRNKHIQTQGPPCRGPPSGV